MEYETDVEDERIRVEALLEKLRIEAEVLVFWLACGDLKMYRAIVNGDQSPEMEGAQIKIHKVLKDEDWWQDIQKIRRNARAFHNRGSNQASYRSRRGSLSQEGGGPSTQLPMADGLKRFIQSSGRRQSITSFRTTRGVSLGMQTHHLFDALVDYDAADNTSDSSSDESAFEPYVSDDGSDSDSDSGSDGGQDADRNTMTGMTAPRLSSPDRSGPSPGPAVPGGDEQAPPTFLTPDYGRSSPQGQQSGTVRPNASRRASSNRFSSAPIPEARVNADETGGPSIMFSENSSAPRSQKNNAGSIYTRHICSPTSDSETQPTASGYPSQAAIPLSFNDLPSRAQHLILNELMIQQSADTAVIFTTLPSPSDGTSHSEEASESYLSDLDVLWQGLPPSLLVHSNSMTVTMNL